MWKIEVALDEEKVKAGGKYSLEKMYAVIDGVFEEADMERRAIEDKTLVYIGNAKSDRHFAMMWDAIFQLEEQDWFTDNILRWEWFKSENNQEPYEFDYSEDIIEELNC